MTFDPTTAREAALRRDRYRCRQPGCQAPATDVHHRVSRRRGGKLADAALAGLALDPADPRLGYLVALCHPHHMAEHASGTPRWYLRGSFATDKLAGVVVYTGPDETLAATWPPAAGRNLA